MSTIHFENYQLKAETLLEQYIFWSLLKLEQYKIKLHLFSKLLLFILLNHFSNPHVRIMLQNNQTFNFICHVAGSYPGIGQGGGGTSQNVDFPIFSVQSWNGVYSHASCLFHIPMNISGDNTHVTGITVYIDLMKKVISPI